MGPERPRIWTGGRMTLPTFCGSVVMLARQDYDDNRPHIRDIQALEVLSWFRHAVVFLLPEAQSLS